MAIKGIAASLLCLVSLWESQQPFLADTQAAQWRGAGGEELPQPCEGAILEADSPTRVYLSDDCDPG